MACGEQTSPHAVLWRQAHFLSAQSPVDTYLYLEKIRLSFPHSVKISRQMCVMLTSSTQTHIDSCVVRSQGRCLFTQQVTWPLLILFFFFKACTYAFYCFVSILLFFFFLFNTIQQIVGCDSIPCLCSGVLCLLGFFHAYLFLYYVRAKGSLVWAIHIYTPCHCSRHCPTKTVFST